MIQRTKKSFLLFLFFALFIAYITFVSVQGPIRISNFSLPIPNFSAPLAKSSVEELQITPTLHSISSDSLNTEREALIASRRKVQINKVKRFFKVYGSPLQGYEAIFVDRSEKCGGDYRVLVGIAGSESGLGRSNYKKYNPFGYLDGIEYPDQEHALKALACKISEQHISKCGTDLYCLGRRYAGPGDDLDHFVGKVQWFFNQVK